MVERGQPDDFTDLHVSHQGFITLQVLFRG